MSFSLPAADRLAESVRALAREVATEAADRDAREGRAADELFLAALDIATEMWFQKGDPSAPELTDWELPWRKFGGDNPTTSYLSASVSPDHVYLLEGPVLDAVYVGVQAYTRGPGYNAPSANISDARLVREGHVRLVIGGLDPGDGSPWLPLAQDDYLVMVRAYHRAPSAAPPLRISRIDAAPGRPLTSGQRFEAAVDFFEEAVRSTLAVTDTLRGAGANAYPAADAEVKRPRYTGALFPTLDNVYDGFWVDLPEGTALRLRGVPPRARYTSLVFYDRWFCTPDYRRVRCYLTGEDLVLGEDGRYDVLLGPTDPGTPNWIDTDDLRQGIFAIRMLLPESRELPTVEVVPVR